MFAKLYAVTKPVPMWQVVYFDPLKRRKIRRHFRDEEMARAHQATLNGRIMVEGTQGINFDANVRADAVAARQMLDLSGHPAVTLQQLARDYLDRAVKHAAGSEPIGTALATFIAEKRDAEGRTEATVTNLENRLWAWINREQITTVGDVTRERIEPLRTREGVGRQSRRNDLNAVSSFCSHLVDRRKLTHHPMEGMRRPVIERERPAVLTADACRRLLEAAQQDGGGDARTTRGQWLGTVAVMIFCGLRPSELAAARIYYGARPAIRIEGGKRRGRANRIVPLIPAAVAWLKAAGSPEQVEEMNSRARNRLVAAAGIEWTTDVCRHTYISHRLQLVKNDAQVAREAGTSEGIIYRHYHRLIAPTEARAWAALRPKNSKLNTTP